MTHVEPAKLLPRRGSASNHMEFTMPHTEFPLTHIELTTPYGGFSLSLFPISTIWNMPNVFTGSLPCPTCSLLHPYPIGDLPRPM